MHCAGCVGIEPARAACPSFPILVLSTVPHNLIPFLSCTRRPFFFKHSGAGTWPRENISYLSQYRANIFAQTAAKFVSDGAPYDSDAASTSGGVLAILFFIRYSDPGEIRPVKPVPKFRH